MSRTPSHDALRSVRILKEFSYCVPSYQRGYRWKEYDVHSLLEDLDEFTTVPLAHDKNQQSFYCLQPLVVRASESDSACYDVIDGQQRLTTLFLICLFLNNELNGNDRGFPFSIAYESRPDTEKFLKELAAMDPTQIEIDESNIDFFHISTALKTISDWFHEKKTTTQECQDFSDKLHEHVKVIWYEPESDDSISAFTRLNVGKISLTSEELIKATLLQPSDTEVSTAVTLQTESRRLKQLEIAGEWDRMEAAFHDPGFWFFLNSPDADSPTRIKLVFQIFTGEWQSDQDDRYVVYRAFLKKLNTSNDLTPESCWAEIKRIFQRLEEWYQDHTCYHKVGYLIAIDKSLKDICSWTADPDGHPLAKSAFMHRLDEEIAKTIPPDLETIKYGNPKVKEMLLLHNIQSHLDVPEASRFPFDLYKHKEGHDKKPWDVEHIHSVSEEAPAGKIHQEEWLVATKDFLERISATIPKYTQQSKGFIQKINALKASLSWQENEFQTLHDKIIEFYNEADQAEPINDLSNLALLDAHTNRSYGNSVFPLKRETIIQHERKGIFVPLCTKNAFMKFYTKKIQNFTFWTESDRDTYFKDMEEKINRARSSCDN